MTCGQAVACFPTPCLPVDGLLDLPPVKHGRILSEASRAPQPHRRRGRHASGRPRQLEQIMVNLNTRGTTRAFPSEVEFSRHAGRPPPVRAL